MRKLAALFLVGFTASISAEELKRFEADGLYGYKTQSGEIRIPARFNYADSFQCGAASVIEKGKAVLIDQKGEIILEIFLFDNGPDYFKEGLARFIENGKMGFFDCGGRKVIAASFDFAHPFSGGRADVCNGCKRRAMGEHYTMEGGTWMSVDRQGRLTPASEPKSHR